MTVRCEDVQARLSDRLLGDGGDGADEALEAHLQGCGECRRFLDEAVWQDLALSEEAAKAEVPEILRRWRGLPAPRRATLRRVPARSPLPYIAAAGILLAALGLVIGRATSRPAPPRPSPPPVASARAEEARAGEERRQAEERLLEIERQRERLRLAVEAAERERQEADRKRAMEELARIARDRYQAEAALEKARENVRRAEEETLRRPDPPPPARAGTVAAAAAVENVVGDVRLAGGEKLERGQWIAPGQAVETGADGGFAVLLFPDGTRVALEPGSRIDDVAASPAKRIVLSRGAARARVAPQPAGAPMVFSTPHGEAKVLGTVLRLAVDPRSAELVVERGRVVLTTPDGHSAQVNGGHAAAAVAGRPPVARPIRETTLHFQDGVSPDPFYEGARDTALREHDPTVPGGARLKLEPDGDEPSRTDHDVAALLRWDLSAIPPGSKVVTASLTFSAIDDSKHVYEIAELRRPWVEAEATWLGPSSGSAWQSPGASGTADRSSRAMGTLGPAVKGDVSVLLNDEGLRVLQGWIDKPATNHGLVVHGSGNTDGVEFYSREHRQPSQRPRLSVTFVPARER